MAALEHGGVDIDPDKPPPIDFPKNLGGPQRAP
jgi:hypothetical protein